MDASKFTTRSQEAINAAISAAASAGHAQVEAVHLLAALLAQPEGIIHPLLQAVGVQPSTVEAGVRAELGRLPAASGTTVAAPSYSRAALQVLSKAADIAAEMKDDFISTEHLLIAPPPSTRPPGTRAHRGRGDAPTRCAVRWPACAAPPGSPARTPSRPTRRSRSTPST